MKTIFNIIFCLISTFGFSQKKANHLIISRHNSECIIDENNVELIPSRQYSNIWTAYDTAGKYFIVTNFQSKEGIYELGNKAIVPCIYDDISVFRNHGFIKKGEDWAVISSGFKVQSDFIFESINSFNKEGLALVKQNSQWIRIDTNGKIITQLPFDEVFQFNEDEVYKKAGINKKYGFVNRNYNIVIPFEYEDVAIAINNVNDVFPVKKNGKWGYVNKQNLVIVPFKYDYVTPVYKGFGWIRDKNFNTIGLVDNRGNVLFDDGRYIDVKYAEEGKLIYAIKNSPHAQRIEGYLDSATLQVILTAQYENCESFNSGHAIVKKDGLSAVIDKSGNIVLPYQYQNIYRWGDKYIVTFNGRNGMIDGKGKIITPLEYDSFAYGGSYATITKVGLKGIMHYSGKVIVPPKYDEVRVISENVFYGIDGNRKLLIHSNGTEKEIE